MSYSFCRLVCNVITYIYLTSFFYHTLFLLFVTSILFYLFLLLFTLIYLHIGLALPLPIPGISYLLRHGWDNLKSMQEIGDGLLKNRKDIENGNGENSKFESMFFAHLQLIIH